MGFYFLNIRYHVSVGRDVTSAEASAESEALADSVINDDAEEDEDETQQMQSTTASTDLRIIEDTAESWDLEDGKRVSGRRRKTNRRVKTTNRYNKLNSNKGMSKWYCYVFNLKLILII